MIDEHAALKGAQAAVGEDPIEDVAIAFPVGTTHKQAAGMLAGDGVGLASGALAGLQLSGSAGTGGAIGQLIEQRHMERTEPAASIVLALTASKLYLLARHKIGPLASFKDLTIIHEIAREQIDASLNPTGGVTRSLTITDEESGAVFEYEVKPLGSGINKLLTDLKMVK